MRIAARGLLRVPTLAGALACLALAIAFPGGQGANAGVATSNAVLLDPFDPVPEIQFRHYGGYGSHGDWDCRGPCGRRHAECGGGCEHRSRCADDCERDCRGDCDRRSDCDEDCRRHMHCEGDCRRDCDQTCELNHASTAPPCESHCYDGERWEHRWRNGDRVGREWYDSGSKERTVQDGDAGYGRYRNEDYDESGDDDSDDAADSAPYSRHRGHRDDERGHGDGDHDRGYRDHDRDHDHDRGYRERDDDHDRD